MCLFFLLLGRFLRILGLAQLRVFLCWGFRLGRCPLWLCCHAGYLQMSVVGGPLGQGGLLLLFLDPTPIFTGFFVLLLLLGRLLFFVLV